MSYEKSHGVFVNAGKDMSMQIANHLEIKIDKKKKILVKTVLLAKQDKIACQKRVNMRRMQKLEKEDSWTCHQLKKVWCDN